MATRPVDVGDVAGRNFGRRHVDLGGLLCFLLLGPAWRKLFGAVTSGQTLLQAKEPNSISQIQIDTVLVDIKPRQYSLGCQVSLMLWF